MKEYLLNCIIIDIILLIGIFYLTEYARVELNATYIPVFNELSLQRFLFVIIIAIAIIFYEKIYTLRYDFWQETYKMIKSFFLAYFIVLALLTLQKNSLEYSRLFITLYFLFAILLLPAATRLIKRIIYSFSFFKRRVFIIGDASQVNALKNEFEKNWHLGMQPSRKNYDMIMISSKSLKPEKMNAKIEKYLKDNDEVYVMPYATSINFTNSNIMEYSNIRYNTIQIQNKLLIKRNIWIKNGFDFFAALMILPFFLIIHIFIAIAIKLDSRGSIFFRQERLGKNEETFLCYKYKTIYENSQKLLSQYLRTPHDNKQSISTTSKQCAKGCHHARLVYSHDIICFWQDSVC